MSDQCFSSLPEITGFSNRFLSDVLLFLSFMHSHPLYFSFLFFIFSPYFIRLFSYLSPLFITTSLLLLAFLTLSPGIIHDKSKMGLLFASYNAVMERLRSSNTEIDKGDEEFRQFEELEAYKIVFDTSSFYEKEEVISEEKGCRELEEPHVKASGDGHTASGKFESLFARSEGKTVEVAWKNIAESVKEVKDLEGLFKELDAFDGMEFNLDDKKVKLPSTDSDKDGENKKESPVGMGSDVTEGFKDLSVEVSAYNGDECTSKLSANSIVFQDEEVDNGVEDASRNFSRSDVDADASANAADNCGEYSSKSMMNSLNFRADINGTWSRSSRTLDSNLGAYGSMRREKEWKKTLACKLFEERNNANGSPEGMDSLWETYETNRTSKAKSKINNKGKNKKKDEPEDEDEEEGMGGRLCCLRALKFSNVGMGKPNLMKFSKAIKGMGWLHQVTKHGKRGRVEN